MAREPFSLQSAVLATLPFKELERICFGPPSVIQNAVGQECDWNLWRDRAQIIYGTPYDFFDLPWLFSSRLGQREISGVQRYIEVSNYYRLNEQAIFEGLRGIYEPAAALVESLERNDFQALPYFLSLASPEILEYVREKISQQRNISQEARREFSLLTGIELPSLPIEELSQEDLQLALAEEGSLEALLSLLQLYEAGANEQLRRDILKAVLRSGKSQLFDLLMIRFFSLARDFSVEQLIPNLPFQVLSPDWRRSRKDRPAFPLTDLSFLPPDLFGEEEREAIFQAAVYGSNPQIVDFFRSYFDQGAIMESVLQSLFQGYFQYRRPVETYSILQRFAPFLFGEEAFDEMGNSDFFIYIVTALLQEEDHYNYSTPSSPIEGPYSPQSSFSKNLGNIPLLLLVKDYAYLVGSRIPGNYFLAQEEGPTAFPLSRRIYKEIAAFYKEI